MCVPIEYYADQYDKWSGDLETAPKNGLMDCCSSERKREIFRTVPVMGWKTFAYNACVAPVMPIYRGMDYISKDKNVKLSTDNCNILRINNLPWEKRSMMNSLLSNWNDNLTTLSMQHIFIFGVGFIMRKKMNNFALRHIECQVKRNVFRVFNHVVTGISIQNQYDQLKFDINSHTVHMNMQINNKPYAFVDNVIKKIDLYDLELGRLQDERIKNSIMDHNW